MDKMMACRARFEASKMDSTAIESLDPYFELADAWLRHGCADGLVLLHAVAARKQLSRVSMLALSAFLDTRLVPGLPAAGAPTTAATAAATPFHCADANSFGAQLALGITRQLEEAGSIAASISKDTMRATGGTAHGLLLLAHHHPSSAHAAFVHEQFEDIARHGDNMPLARQLCRAAAVRASTSPAFAVFTALLPDTALAAAAFSAAAAPTGQLPPWEWLAAWVAHIVRAPPLRWVTGPVLVSTMDPLRIHAPQAVDTRQYTLVLATAEAVRLEFHSTPEATETGAPPVSTLVLAPGSACWLQRPHDALCTVGNRAVIAVMSALSSAQPPSSQRAAAYTTRVTFPQA
jgi:hypothetical protein